MAPKYLTTTEAADAVGITRATLHNWIKNGRVRPPKLQSGNMLVRLWTESDVARLRAVKGTIRIGRPKKGKKSKV
jgi:excisionase family DNA binding protein